MGISADYENMAKKVQDFASIQKQSDEITALVYELEKVCNRACIELEKEYITIKNTQI